MMLEELERRNDSQSTVRAYVKTIEDLARYFKRPPDQLGPSQLRQYQAYLFRERKLAPNTMIQRRAALRCVLSVAPLPPTLGFPSQVAHSPRFPGSYRLKSGIENA
jgi:Phage integrase, N-terminal SAM-like domain